MNNIHRRRLRALADFLEGPVAAAEERSGNQKFFMGWYTSKIGRPSLAKSGCATSACALGWATVRFKRAWRMDGCSPLLRQNTELLPTSAAAVFFGLTYERAAQLFGMETRSIQQEATLLRQAAEEGR